MATFTLVGPAVLVLVLGLIAAAVRLRGLLAAAVVVATTSATLYVVLAGAWTEPP